MHLHKKPEPPHKTYYHVEVLVTCSCTVKGCKRKRSIFSYALLYIADSYTCASYILINASIAVGELKIGIIIFGASGAGSTTLGKEVAERLKYQYLDIDDYLWRWDTAIPLTLTNTREERAKRLMDDIQKYPNFVIAGTIFSDREQFEPLLDLAVFISTPTDICTKRVYAREYTRWGCRVLPGGDMYKSTRFHGDYSDYVTNAEKYETADVAKFGRKLHEHWIAELHCPVLRVDGMTDVSKNSDLVVVHFNKATK